MKNGGMDLTISTHVKQFKTRSSEFIMSQKTAGHTVNYKYLQRDGQEANLTGRLKTDNFFSQPNTDFTPNSTNPYHKTPATSQRRTHYRNMTAYKLSSNQPEPMSPIYAGGHTIKSPPNQIITVDNKIRPGSIYSGHRHAQRKFVNQKNIQNNRNFLVMQNQINQSQEQSHNQKRQLRRQILRRGRPQTQGGQKVFTAFGNSNQDLDHERRASYSTKQHIPSPKTNIHCSVPNYRGGMDVSKRARLRQTNNYMSPALPYMGDGNTR